jgi:hypothetical protein
MDEDQDFETFLREWAKERIWPTDDALLQHFLTKARAIELIQLAVARGFRDELMETQRKYGSVQAYVKHLMSQSSSIAEKHQHLVPRRPHKHTMTER